MLTIIIPPVKAESCSPQIMRTIAYSTHAMLKKQGISARLLDCLEDDKEFRSFCKSAVKQIDVVCLVVFISNWDAAKKLIRRIRQNRSADRRIIIIGPLAAYFYRELIAEGWADIVIRADAEFIVPQMVLANFEKGAMAKLPNLTFKQHAQIINTFQRMYDQLDEIPFVSMYFVDRKLTAVVSTSKGCHFPCTFCDRKYVWGGKIRFRSVLNVVAELKQLADSGVQSIFFNDDNFIIDKERVRKICLQMIRQKIALRWECNSRIDAASSETLRIMRVAGCTMIYYGIESGSAEVRVSLRKNLPLDDIRKAVQMTRKAGIRVGIYFMTGSPGEDQAAFLETVNLVKTLQPIDHMIVNAVALLPGTMLYEDYVARNGLERDFILKKKWPIYYQKNGLRKSRQLQNLYKDNKH